MIAQCYSPWQVTNQQKRFQGKSILKIAILVARVLLSQLWLQIGFVDNQQNTDTVNLCSDRGDIYFHCLLSNFDWTYGTRK